MKTLTAAMTRALQSAGYYPDCYGGANRIRCSAGTGKALIQRGLAEYREIAPASGGHPAQTGLFITEAGRAALETK